MTRQASDMQPVSEAHSVNNASDQAHSRTALLGIERIHVFK